MRVVELSGKRQCIACKRAGALSRLPAAYRVQGVKTMGGNLYGLFLARQAGLDDKPCLIWRDETLLHFGDVAEAVGRYRTVLADLGVRRGDRVLVQVERTPNFVFLYLACLALGAIIVPLNTGYTEAELAYFVSDAEPSLVVGCSANREMLQRVAAGAGNPPVETLHADGSGTLEQRAARALANPAIEQVSPDDVAAILYTSGTTGRPKGAMLTHRNLASNVEALNQTWHFTIDDVILHALPLFHAHGLFVALHLALWSGNTTIMLEKFDPDLVIDRLGEASVFMGVPTYYTRLLACPRFNREACRNIRVFISGSAPLLPQTFAEFEARTGHRILERYGMTEAAMITSNPYDQAGRIPGTVGFALPYVETRIAGPDGTAQPPGEPGVLEIRGPNVLKGYWRKPEATTDSFTADGFFITGDVAVMDETGRITLVGRAKDLIISGGFNIYPAEIETVLNTVPGVKETAVIGVPHSDFGEAVVAVVVPEADGSVTPEALGAAIKDRIARFKQPKAYVLVDELPRNTMGKVVKAQLREQYRDLLA